MENFVRKLNLKIHKKIPEKTNLVMWAYALEVLGEQILEKFMKVNVETEIESN